jgi:hypothetical protein
MSIKKITSRIIHKHAVESDWIKAKNFIPMQGELIIYDQDETHSYERFKIGDGKTNVNQLAFADDTKANLEIVVLRSHPVLEHDFTEDF